MTHDDAPTFSIDHAASLVGAGRLDEVIAEYRKRSPNDGTLADLHKRLGDDLYRAKYNAEAVICYDEAARLSPSPIGALYNCALAFKKLSKPLEAISPLERIISIEPGLVDAHKLLGEMYFLAGEYEQSVAQYGLALTLAPGDRILEYRRRKSLIAQKKGLDDVAEVFSNIYAHYAWGQDKAGKHRFFSGEGSHDPATVDLYVREVTAFLSSFSDKPSVVDIGCGDFNVGSKIRSACGPYTALDVVEELIEYNTTKFGDLDVDFRVLNIVDQPPPKARVFFIREVFQHLSNAQIAKALANIEGRYDFLIFTEVVPDGDFVPNKDKPSGENIRLNLNNSAVVLTAPPFNVKFRQGRILCRVKREGCWVVTHLFEA